VLAQNPYPSPSSTYGAPAMPPTYPGATGNVISPLPPSTYVNQQPGVSLPPAGADSSSSALIDSRIKAYMDEDAKKKKEADDKKKAEDAAKGIEIVNNTPLTAVFNNGFYLQGADNAFRLHMGTEVELDTVKWIQPANTLPFLAANEGFLDNGIFFRRVRWKFDGTIWETTEFNLVMAFEGLNFIQFDHMWFGMKEIPILGTVQVGHHKIWQGMESIARNEDLPMME